MTQSRAYRRHQRERMIARRYNKYRSIYHGFTEEEAYEAARRTIDISTGCSCPFCGNPRKWFNERTRKEQAAEFDTKLQLDEFIPEYGYETRNLIENFPICPFRDCKFWRKDWTDLRCSGRECERYSEFLGRE